MVDPTSKRQPTLADRLVGLARAVGRLNTRVDTLEASPSSSAWGGITGTLADQTDLQAALDGKQASGSYAASAHGHVIADVTGLQTALDGKQAAGSYQPLATVLTNTTAAFTTAQETKLSGIATGATANSSDATLLDRANHTGSQAISTVTGLQTALDGKQASGSYQPLATVLTNTTASFTTAQETKLAGIADGAQADKWSYAKLATTATNSTTSIVDTALAFTPEANSFYEIEICLFMQAAATTTGARPGIKWPTAGITQSSGCFYAPNSATAYITRVWNGTGAQNAATTGIGVANVDQFAEGRFLMITGSSVTGDFIVTLASEIAASEVRITANSFIKYRKVP